MEPHILAVMYAKHCKTLQNIAKHCKTLQNTSKLGMATPPVRVKLTWHTADHNNGDGDGDVFKTQLRSADI